MLNFPRRAALSFLCLLTAAHAVELPRGLNISGSDDVQKLTLGDAIGMVLTNNLEVQFNLVDAKIEEARKRFAAGAFDPLFSTNASRQLFFTPDLTSNLSTAQQAALASQFPTIFGNNSEIIIFDQHSDRWESSISGRTPLGTRFAFTARESKTLSTFQGDVRSIRPFYQAFGGIDVRQPLLKDFGTAANLADIRVARISQKVAELGWQKGVSDAISSVLGNYIDMLFAQADLRVKQDAIAADEKLVQQNQRRLELGFMSPIDVQQARAQVSLDQEQQLLSKNVFMERQFALRRLISKEAGQHSSRLFLPVETPNLDLPKLDRPALLNAAFTKRLDYIAAVTEAGKQDIRLAFARNQLWPQLDVLGTYGYNGLGNNEHEARNGAADSQAPQWSLGVQISIPLGNVQARAQLAAIKGFKEQAILKIRQSEITVTVDVDTALSRIETSQQRLTTARQTRALNEEAVRIAYRRLEAGQVSSFDLIEQQRKVYDAASRELAAKADLNKSIATLWQATGTVLENMGIAIVRTGKRAAEITAVQSASAKYAPEIITARGARAETGTANKPAK
jgi:outer membrane protein TolC